jgi:hypothetical protein
MVEYLATKLGHFGVSVLVNIHHHAYHGQKFDEETLLDGHPSIFKGICVPIERIPIMGWMTINNSSHYSIYSSVFNGFIFHISHYNSVKHDECPSYSHYIPIIFPVYSQHIPIFRPYIILEVRNTHDIPIIYTNYNIYICMGQNRWIIVYFIILHSDFPWYAHYVPTIHPIVGEIHQCYQWLFQGPKLKVPTIDAYVRPRFQQISPQNMALHGTVPPF